MTFPSHEHGMLYQVSTHVTTHDTKSSNTLLYVVAQSRQGIVQSDAPEPETDAHKQQDEPLRARWRRKRFERRLKTCCAYVLRV